MKRSIGVTVIAILSLLGSLFALLMGAFVAVIPFFAPEVDSGASPLSPGFFKVMMVVAALIYILPAIWGIITSVGLFRLKEWARISIIIFSVLLILMSAFGGLISLVMPTPPVPNRADVANVATGVRIFMGALTAVMVGIGVWWLVFFTRGRTKQQFRPLPTVAFGASAPVLNLDHGLNVAVPISPSRPLSFTILAWFLLASCLFIPLNFWLHPPVIFLTTLLMGWPATLYMVVIAALNLYIGIGLLRLKLIARTVAIAYYVFFFVNTAIFYLAPGGRSRMLEMFRISQSMFPFIKPLGVDNQFVAPSNATPFLLMGVVGGLIGIMVPLYFLITRQKAFELAAAAAKGKSEALQG